MFLCSKYGTHTTQLSETYSNIRYDIGIEIFPFDSVIHACYFSIPY